MENETYDHEIITRTDEFCNITTHYHGTIEGVVEKSRAIKQRVALPDGISEADFRGCIDNLLTGKPVLGGIELWEKMNPLQKEVCQTIKRAMKRIKYNEE